MPVGDSIGMILHGFDSTLLLTLETRVHHTVPVSRGNQHAWVVADLPFGG
jgi:3-methyl-2-oxobutanoate hydroxymethyltransferase